MTKILTIRLASDEMAECDARARELGVTRTDYVRSRLFSQGLETKNREKRRFSSLDLIGSVSSGSGSTNSQVRAVMRKRK